jgi:predicted phage terminase large subunit-like protein
MPTFQWNAQYQQKPTAEEASIVKREWWNWWGEENPPACEYVIMSLDSAAEKHNRADYTALTTWGVFYNEDDNAYNIILLNSIKQRIEFHELKELAMQEYADWEPDSFIVEKKSSGVALYQEMRRMGLPVSEYTPHRGSGDKLARLNAVSDIVASGLCWVPQTRWAEEVVEEIYAPPVFYIYRNESRSEIKCCNPKNQIRDHPEKKVFIPIPRLRNQIWDKYHFSGTQLWQCRAKGREIIMPPRRTGFNENTCLRGSA